MDASLTLLLTTNTKSISKPSSVFKIIISPWLLQKHYDWPLCFHFWYPLSKAMALLILLNTNPITSFLWFGNLHDFPFSLEKNPKSWLWLFRPFMIVHFITFLSSLAPPSLLLQPHWIPCYSLTTWAFCTSPYWTAVPSKTCVTHFLSKKPI